MAIALKQVESTGDLLQFIQFPRKMYSVASPWVSPLDYERKNFLDPGVNPFFGHAEAAHFLALDNRGEPVGRISAIVDHDHNRVHHESTGFFGMFECHHHSEAADALLDAAGQWCRNKGMECLRGPMNLSSNHECGLLVENFNDPPLIGIPYNPPYYEEMLQQWGLKKLKDLISFEIQITGIPEYLKRAIPLIQKRNRFSVRPLRLDRFDREMDVLWDIYNSAWESNWGFVPMNRREFLYTAKELKAIVNPEFCLIAEVRGESAGFSLALPDINQALRPLRGKLFPFGWLKFMLGRKKINRYRVITLGVKKKYQRLGIDAYFYYAIYQKLLAMNIPVTDTSWVLEDNQAIIDPIRRIGGVPYKRHRIYERSLSH